MTRKTKMPVLFIGHGSPMNAIEDNEFTHGWQELVKTLPKPKAIVCISAHWETDGVFVTASSSPETIHDFYGFPKELFAVRYNTEGDVSLAKEIVRLVKSAEVKLDEERGLDHGVWGVLLPMYPDADIPVVQLSMDRSQPPLFHYEIGGQLASLRDEGILIICSGNIVHNLRMLKFHDPKPYEWAEKFNEEIKRLITTGNHNQIIDYKSLGQIAELSVPTPEHFWPLLYAIGLQEAGERVSFFNDKVISSISMTSVIIGN